MSHYINLKLFAYHLDFYKNNNFRRANNLQVLVRL